MWVYPRVIAHRGAGNLAPENTLAALRCAVRHGFRAVEFDVMLSSDEIAVLMHDPQFGRTVRRRGRVSDTSAAELRRIDVGAWHSPGFAGETVPLYEDAVNYCKRNNIWMNVEIKPTPGFEVLTGRRVAEMTRRLFYDELVAAALDGVCTGLPLFSSFSFEALAAAQAAAPEIPRGLLLDTIPSDWQQQLQALDAVALHTQHRRLRPEQVQAVKAAGFGLFCYTVNTPARAREILGWGVDAFCTDRIDLIGPDFG